MVKVDPKRNYYADLEISPDADTDDIRKQFRKLALKWHPDRNQGKEADCVPKFQAIQAAHEILVDPEQRRKYDSERRKTAGFYTTASRPNVPTRGNPYQATSNFPPPPRRTARPQPQQPRPEYRSTASHGASRFTSFKPPPTSQKPGSQDGPEAKANFYNAWQNMNHTNTTKPKVPPRNTDDTFARGKTAWEGVNRTQQQSDSGFRRSASTRTPRKGGFDPAVPGADEPPARGTSGYTSTRYSARQDPETQFQPESPAEPSSSYAEPPKPSPQHTTAEANVPYSDGSPRPRAPYGSTGGERIFLNPVGRSASMRVPPSQASPGTAQTPPSATHRSSQSYTNASPPRRGGNATRPFAMYSSSEDEEVVEIPNPNQNRRAQRASEPNPSRTQPQAPTGASEQAQPNAADPGPAQANGEMGQKSQSTMYGNHPFNHPHSFVREPPSFQVDPRADQKSQQKKGKWPHWAIPSTVRPPSSASATPPSADRKRSRANTRSQFGVPLTPPLQSEQADRNWNRFTMPINHDTFAKPNQDYVKSRSTDSINTKFSENHWSGQFVGTPDYLVGGQGNSRKTASPVAGKAANAPKPQTGVNGHPASGQMPPPPSGPPPLQKPASASSAGTSAPPLGASVPFSPEAWLGNFGSSDFAVPPTKPPSPGKAPPVRRGTKPTISRSSSHANTRSGATKPKPASVSDDVPNGSSDKTASTASTSTAESSAMDIDSDPVETKSKPARAVPVAPSRPEWREPAPQTAPPIPPKPAQQPPQATDGADAIHMGEFQNVAPFGKTSQAGLFGLEEIGSSLPFASGASPVGPTRADSPPALELPSPPRPPESPPRLTKSSWDEYRQRASVYMIEWNRFDSMMLQHLAARQQATEQLGIPAVWMGAVGDSSSRGGFGSYMQGLREDKRVRMHWHISHERHLHVMEKFEDIRNKVLGLKGGLPLN